MAKYYEVTVSHKDPNTGKNRYVKVGALFPVKDGFSLKIDPGISISTMGGVSIWCNPPRDKDGQQHGFTPRGKSQEEVLGEDAVDLPF